MINKIFPVRALRDNYIWILCDPMSHTTWAIDPGDAQPVITFLQEKKFSLTGILITHHHFDHSNGINDLLKNYPQLKIYGSKQSPLSQLTHHLIDKQMIQTDFFQLMTLTIPGHTLDHLAFYNDHILFCGDTLFSAGCGKIFEGTPQMMYDSLNKIKSLNEQIYLFCGHEYTFNNLRFAKCVEPENQHILQKITYIQNKLASDKMICTLPSTLFEEKNINPFLRCEIPTVIQSAENYCGKKLHHPVEVFSVLREWKNNFN